LRNVKKLPWKQDLHLGTSQINTRAIYLEGSAAAVPPQKQSLDYKAIQHLHWDPAIMTLAIGGGRGLWKGNAATHVMLL